MSNLKVYEVMRSYITGEMFHVKAESEEDAIKQFGQENTRFISSYEEEYISPPTNVQIEGPWESIEEYEAEYGAFES